MMQEAIAGCILLTLYGLILTEALHRALAAMACSRPPGGQHTAGSTRGHHAVCVIQHDVDVLGPAAPTHKTNMSKSKPQASSTAPRPAIPGW